MKKNTMHATCLICDTTVEVVNGGNLARHDCTPKNKALPTRLPKTKTEKAQTIIKASFSDTHAEALLPSPFGPRR